MISNDPRIQLMADMSKLRAEAMQQDVLPRSVANELNVGISATQQTQKTDFGGLLKSAINQVNTLQQESGALKKAYELGKPNVDIAQVMIASEKANVGFTAMVEVRNKFVEAYRDVMNMSV